MVFHNSFPWRSISKITMCKSKFFSFIIFNLSIVSSSFYFVSTLANSLCAKSVINRLFLFFNSAIFILDCYLSLIKDSLWIVSFSTFFSMFFYYCSNYCFYAWFNNWLCASSNCLANASFSFCNFVICVVIAHFLPPTMRTIYLSWSTIKLNLVSVSLTSPNPLVMATPSLLKSWWSCSLLLVVVRCSLCGIILFSSGCKFSWTFCYTISNGCCFGIPSSISC